MIFCFVFLQRYRNKVHSEFTFSFQFFGLVELVLPPKLRNIIVASCKQVKLSWKYKEKGRGVITTQTDGMLTTCEWLSYALCIVTHLILKTILWLALLPSSLYWWGIGWFAQSYPLQEPGAKHRQSDVTTSSLGHYIMLFLIKVGLDFNMPLFLLEIVVSNLIDTHSCLPSRMWQCLTKHH